MMCSYHILRQRKDIKNDYLWGVNQLFSKGNYVSSLGNISKDDALNYIKRQENYENLENISL